LPLLRYKTTRHLWVVLEYCAGGDLRQILSMDATFPEETLRQFGLDLTRALQYCHSRGVIHGDLRPANVLLSDDGRLRVADFSLAWHASEAPQEQGAPYYMAPERFHRTGTGEEAEKVIHDAD